TLARSAKRGSIDAIAASRPAFLGRLDGLVVGGAAANGIFAGSLFLHPDFNLALEMPGGWKTANTPDAAGAAAPDSTAVVLLQAVGAGEDPVAGARAQGISEALLQRVRRRQIGQLPAATLLGSTRDGHRIAMTWIAHDRRIFRVTGLSGERE